MRTEGYQYYRIKLKYLTDEQIKQIKRMSDIRRFTYNWGVDYCNALQEEGKNYPGFQKLTKAFTEYRHANPWLMEYNLTVCRYALKDLDKGYQYYFSKVNKAKPTKFCRKKYDSIRFASRPDRFRIFGRNGNYAYIPGICTHRGDYVYIGTHRIPYGLGVKYDNVRIKHDGVDYWLTVSVSVPPVEIPIINSNPNTTEPIGIDVGARKAATLSNGKIYPSFNKSRMKVLNNRIRYYSDKISKDICRRLDIESRTKTKYEDIPKSKNQLKREHIYRKSLNRKRNIVTTLYHQISRDIVNTNPEYVVVETLIMKDVYRETQAPEALRDARIELLVRYIEYKCKDAGIPVIKAPSDYPSSQICSKCGYVHKTGRGKYHTCPNCGAKIDRDINAAINLLNYGISQQLQPLQQILD